MLNYPVHCLQPTRLSYSWEQSHMTMCSVHSLRLQEADIWNCCINSETLIAFICSPCDPMSPRSGKVFCFCYYEEKTGCRQLDFQWTARLPKSRDGIKTHQQEPYVEFSTRTTSNSSTFSIMPLCSDLIATGTCNWTIVQILHIQAFTQQSVPIPFTTWRSRYWLLSCLHLHVLYEPGNDEADDAECACMQNWLCWKLVNLRVKCIL